MYIYTHNFSWKTMQKGSDDDALWNAKEEPRSFLPVLNVQILKAARLDSLQDAETQPETAYF